MNASTLLDGVLDSGRADSVSLITDDGEVTYRRAGRSGGRDGRASPLAGGRARATGADGARRLARVPRVLPRCDADRGRARARQPDGPGRQPRLLPRGQLRQGRRDRGCADREPRRDGGGAAGRACVVGVGGFRRRNRRRRSRGAGRYARRRHGVLALQLGLDGSAQGRRPLAPGYRGHDRELRPSGSAGDSGGRLLLDHEAVPRLRAWEWPVVPYVGGRCRRVGPRAGCARPDPGCAGLASAHALLLGTGSVRRDGPVAGCGWDGFLQRPCLRVRCRAAAGGGAPALDGRGGSADPRRDRVHRDAPHLLLEHSRRPRSRHVRPPRPRLRAPGDRRGGP